jgi:hypothetical protein
VAEWIYFIHPLREDFAATMTEEERRVCGDHWEGTKRLFDEGRVVLRRADDGPAQHRDLRLRGARRSLGARVHGGGSGDLERH